MCPIILWRGIQAMANGVAKAELSKIRSEKDENMNAVNYKFMRASMVKYSSLRGNKKPCGITIPKHMKSK